jgi:hypothetical protein
VDETRSNTLFETINKIPFQAERVTEAWDIRDALRRAESLGATEVTALTRED